MIRVIFVILVASLISCGDEKTKKGKGESPTPPKKQSSYCELTNTIVNCYQDFESHEQKDVLKESKKCLHLQTYLVRFLIDSETSDTENWTEVMGKTKPHLVEVEKCNPDNVKLQEAEVKFLKEMAQCMQKVYLSLQKALC